MCCSSSNRKEKPTLSTYISSKVIPLVISAMVIVSILLISGAWTITLIATNLSTTTLVAQAQRHASSLLQENIALFKQTMTFNVEAVLNYYAFAAEDSFRGLPNDPEAYNLVPINSYFDCPSCIKRPLTYDPVRNQDVSYKASSFLVTNIRENEFNQLTNAQNHTIQQTAHSDYYFERVRTNDFVGLYMGFNKIMRHYPGVGNYDPQRVYRPSSRGWYNSAQTAGSGTTIVTSPYKDFSTSEWMVTYATVLISTADDSVIGVAGADMLIGSLIKNINSITLFNTGKITMFEIDGTVVADKEWNPTPDQLTGFTYTNLQSPSINAGLWGRFLKATYNEVTVFTETINEKEWLISVQRIREFGDKYLMVAFIPMSEVVVSVVPVTESLTASSTYVSVITTIIAILVSGIVICVVLWAVRSVTKKSQKLIAATNHLMEGIGSGKMASNVSKMRLTGFAQDDRSAKAFNGVIKRLAEIEKPPVDPENDFHLVIGNESSVAIPLREEDEHSTSATRESADSAVDLAASDGDV